MLVSFFPIRFFFCSLLWIIHRACGLASWAMGNSQSLYSLPLHTMLYVFFSFFYSPKPLCGCGLSDVSYVLWSPQTICGWRKTIKRRNLWWVVGPNYRHTEQWYKSDSWRQFDTYFSHSQYDCIRLRLLGSVSPLFSFDLICSGDATW